MADSTITQLPLSPYILDKDLMVIVTGHLEDGAFPRNHKIPLAYIRKYIVRLNLLTSPQSGIGSYYNSGVNILTLQHIPRTGNLMRYDYADEPPHHQTISITGLNSIAGNLVDISFAANSDAVLTMNSRSGSWSNDFVNSNFIGNFGDPYHSGVISITGVNARTENNIVKEYEAAWPYTGVYYNSGLNIIVGNNIDIAFLKTDPAANAMSERTGSWPDAFSKDSLEEKYWSGIISTTGLNAYPKNLMRIDYDAAWPHSGSISQTGLNAIRGNLVDISFASNSAAAQAMHNRNGNWDNNFTNNNLGLLYHSGIISFTGVNFTTENNIALDLDVSWPHSGQVYNKKINAIQGNLIDISYDINSLASSGMHNNNGPWYNEFNSGIHIEGKYQSGIISITGVNAVTENNIVKEYQKQWPYSGIYYNTGINAIEGNLIDITFDTDRYRVATLATTGLNMIHSHGTAVNINEAYPHDYAIITIDRSIGKNDNVVFSNNGTNTILYEDELALYFGDLFNSYPYTNMKFLATLIIGIGDSPGDVTIPSANSMRSIELIGAPVIGSDYSVNNWIADSVKLVPSDILTISIVGSDVKPLAKLNTSLRSTAATYSADPGIITLNSTNILNMPEILEEKAIASIYLNNYGCGESLALKAKYQLNNIKYQRIYRYSNSGVYYTSSNQDSTNTNLRFTNNAGRVLKAEHFYEAPSIVWKVQPPNSIETDQANGVVSLTGIAVSTDYTQVKYQWYTSEDNQNFVPLIGQVNSVLNTTIVGTRYFKSLATLYTCDSSFSNTTTAVRPAESIICNHPPSAIIVCDGGNINISAGATVEGAPGAVIDYRWYMGGTPLSSGSTSNGDYTGTHTASLSISNIDINFHRGKEYFLHSSYYIAPVESSGYVTEENGIYNLVTETNQYKIITETPYVAPGRLLSCVSSGSMIWEAAAKSLRHPFDYNSIRDYALFFGSGEAFITNGTIKIPKIPSYQWYRSTNGTGEWQSISSNFPTQSNLGLLDYQYVTNLLNGTSVPATALFLNNLTSGNHLDLYRLVTSYSCSSSSGNPAALTVSTLVITGQPNGALFTGKLPDNKIYNNIVLASGNNKVIELSVAATAFNSAVSINYQWQSGTFYENNPSVINDNSWADIVGQTSDILSLSNLPEVNSGLYLAYRVLLDDYNISSVPIDAIDTLRRKTSNAIKVGTPAFVADSSSEDINYNNLNQEWSIIYQGTTNKVDPAIVIISGLRDLTNIDYDISIRSTTPFDLPNQTGYLHIYDVGIPEISSTGTTLISAAGNDSISLIANTGIYLSVTGVPGQWFAGLIIPS